MPLQVAPCPRCRTPLVYGQRRCRQCQQPFDYGQPGPPEPTFAQIVEALAAVGFAPPAPTTQEAPAVPRLEGLDSGRFAATGDVNVDNIQGFIASSIFANFTPDRVDTVPVQGLDDGRFASIGPVAPQAIPGLEGAPAEVGDVFSQPVSGIFRSDLFAVRQDVAAGGVEGLEASPSQPRATAPKDPQQGAPAAPGGKAAKGAKGTKGAKADELRRVTCRCGEVHRLPRCAACGTPHPDA